MARLASGWWFILASGFIFAAVSAEFNLTIFHVNDVHCRFEEANKYSGTCIKEDVENRKCFGGFPRIVYKANELRKLEPNNVFLSGGDFFQGTIWYTVHKWEVVSHFVNMLNLTAMAFGNHEFDDGINGLLPFVSNAPFPIVSANIDTSEEPRLHGRVGKSAVVNVNGQTVGIIGYLTTETTTISQPENIVIHDEIEGVKQEAARLKKQGVNILIAVGHAGYLKDIAIAEQVPDIDVVVGGHSNTFLWNGPVPSIEESQGPYPTVVTQKSGRKVPVVQAFAFGKYLGHLQVIFDDSGEVTSWSGQPILLDGSVPKDPKVVEELIPYRQKVEAVALRVVGQTKVFLDGNRLSCRMRECNLGNLIADAFVNLYVKYANESMNQWTKASIAIVNGGGVRASVDEKSSGGNFTFGDIRGVLPFPNTVDIIELKGKDLKAVFEFSVTDYEPSALDPFGGFLQVSGLQVTYDITKPNGQRVVELLARCNLCRIPTFEPVQDETIYSVATSTFLANGGDGFKIIKERKLNHLEAGLLDYDALLEYIQVRSPVTIGLEQRIKFTNSRDSVCNIAFRSVPSLSLEKILPLGVRVPMQPFALLLDKQPEEEAVNRTIGRVKINLPTNEEPVLDNGISVPLEDAVKSTENSSKVETTQDER